MKKILIIVAACTVFAILFIAISLQRKPIIEWQVRQAQSCTETSDCTVIDGQCPLGCQIAVRKSRASYIRILLKRYRYPMTCQYRCPAVAHSPECVNDQCTLKRK